MSCYRKGSDDPQPSSTLREEAVILESRISWAKELVPEEKLYDSLENAEDLDPIMIMLSDRLYPESKKPDAVYPYLPDFTVLDTSAYNTAQKDVLDGFCTAIVKKRNADTFVMTGYIHTLVLFKYNLEKEGLSLDEISDYVLGKPFINDNECQCPVRFYAGHERYIDVNLYIVKYGQGWKIHQIEYKKGGKE